MKIREQRNINLLIPLTIGHSINDAFQAFLAPLLPILMATFSLNATQAGLLGFAMSSPSIIQPVIGNLADRKDLRWLVIVAPFITAISMSLVGVSQKYLYVVVLLVLAGVSAAGLHAIAPFIVTSISNGRMGRYIGFFAFGGELGRTLGPIIFVQALGLWTLIGASRWLVFLGLIGTVVLFYGFRGQTPRVIHTEENSQTFGAFLPTLMKVLAPIALMSFVQYISIIAMTLYLPTYLVNQGESLAYGTAMLVILQVGALAGAYLGGLLSDRIGRLATIILTQVGSGIFMLGFLFSGGFFRYPFLVLFGLFATSQAPIVIALLQEHFAENKSLVNGTYFSVNFGVQAIVAPLIGFLMDTLTAHTAFVVCSFIPLLGVPILLLLPKTGIRQKVVYVGD